MSVHVLWPILFVPFLAGLVWQTQISSIATCHLIPGFLSWCLLWEPGQEPKLLPLVNSYQTMPWPSWCSISCRCELHLWSRLFSKDLTVGSKSCHVCLIQITMTITPSSLNSLSLMSLMAGNVLISKTLTDFPCHRMIQVWVSMAVQAAYLSFWYQVVLIQVVVLCKVILDFRDFCLWNPESWALESGFQLTESGFPLMIGIWNQVPWTRNPKSSLWNLGWLPVVSIQSCFDTSLFIQGVNSSRYLA